MVGRKSGRYASACVGKFGVHGVGEWIPRGWKQPRNQDKADISVQDFFFSPPAVSTYMCPKPFALSAPCRMREAIEETKVSVVGGDAFAICTAKCGLTGSLYRYKQSMWTLDDQRRVCCWTCLEHDRQLEKL